MGNEITSGATESNMEEPGKIKSVFNKLMLKETVFNAQSCFIQSKYGSGSYAEPDARIKEKQKQIRKCISDDYLGENAKQLFYCFISIEEALHKYVDEIWKPFKDAGFEIKETTESCQGLIGENKVYIVSWINAFKN